MPGQLNTIQKKTDPRVLRTHRLLLDSFSELLAEHKSIRKISIQDIAAHAGVNRATFYAHFNDKYELMAIWKQELFRQALKGKVGEGENPLNISLEQVIETVSEFVYSYRLYFKRINKEFEPLFEAALQQELQVILQCILEEKPYNLGLISPANMATFLSWAIFGSVNEWSRQPNSRSKEDMKQQLILLVDATTKL